MTGPLWADSSKHSKIRKPRKFLMVFCVHHQFTVKKALNIYIFFNWVIRLNLRTTVSCSSVISEYYFQEKSWKFVMSCHCHQVLHQNHKLNTGFVFFLTLYGFFFFSVVEYLAPRSRMSNSQYLARQCYWTSTVSSLQI